MPKPFSFASLEDMPIIGILRKLPAAQLEKVVQLYQECGLSTLEITMNTQGASEMIRQLSDSFPQLNIGAGTVCKMSELEEAIDAGASFIVTPITDEKLISACKVSGLPVFPGAFTPTEIYRAHEAGADMVKLFPAGLLGPKYIKDVQAPLDQIRLVPVGGVDLQNFCDFLQAGASAVGLGSQLFLKDAIAQQDWERLKNHFAAFVNKFRVYQAAL